MQNSTLFFIAVAIFSGAIVTMQAGMNSTLAKFAQNPLWATTASLTISLVVIAGVLIVARPQLPDVTTMLSAPWWVWLGGVAGAFYVTAAIILAPKLGAAVFLAAIVAGQMIAAIILDHYGIIGFPEKAVTLPRVLGVLMVIGGVLVMQIGRSTPGPDSGTQISINMTKTDTEK